MQENTRKQRFRSGLARWAPRLLSIACLSTVGAWLYLAAIGCVGALSGGDRYMIELEPVRVDLKPNQLCEVEATLTRNDSEVAADQWGLGESPPIIHTPSRTPAQGVSTTVTFFAVDKDLFENYLPLLSPSNECNWFLTVWAEYIDPETLVPIDTERTLPLRYPTSHVALYVQGVEGVGTHSVSLKGIARLWTHSATAEYEFQPSVKVFHQNPDWELCGTVPVTRNGNVGTFDGAVTSNAQLIRLRYWVTQKEPLRTLVAERVLRVR